MALVTISKSFTALGVGQAQLVKHLGSFAYSVSGTFDATVVLERSRNGGSSWEGLLSFTSAGSGSYQVSNPDGQPTLFRFRCSVFASGTVVTSIAEEASVIQEVSDQNGNVLSRLKNTGFEVLVRPDQKRIINVGAKVGATSGWVAGGGAVDTGLLATCPASQSGSTLVVPIPGLKVGDTITAFHLIGQVESAGNTVTLDAALRKHTAAAADVADASVGSITQVSLTADAILSATNAGKSSLSEVVGADETFYVLLTATTGGSTDIALQGIAVTVSEA